MSYIRVEVVRWVDAEWPGWMEVHLREADGSTATIVEKVPVLLWDELPATELGLPAQIDIPCDVLEREQDVVGRAYALVRLRFRIEAQGGRNTFRLPGGDVTGSR
ncbi:hypothetical protein [Cryptosporangium japonicum]|uniref:Uncharacterized protein n=1 Tax=Cryptosporangium japonicum TaxID=80872 RepID=A0ABP3D2V4_9ACTN